MDDSFKRVPAKSASESLYLTSAGVHFDYTNRLFFKFKAVGATEDNVLVRITNGATGASADYAFRDFTALGSDSYRVMTAPIAALDLGTMYTVTLYTVDGEAMTAVQPLEYGVSSYVYSMQNDAEMGDLAQRTYCYGVSAKAYSEAE